MSLPERRILENPEQNLPEGWKVEGGKVCREFTFGSYAMGAMFANAVALLAEQMDHHPDILLSYRRVAISVNTHDLGGISTWDAELARRINVIA